MTDMLYDHGIMSNGIDEFTGHHAALNSIGEDVKHHQTTMAAAQEGVGSQAHQEWQNKWNSGHADVISAAQQITQALSSSLERATGADQQVANSWGA